MDIVAITYQNLFVPKSHSEDTDPFKYEEQTALFKDSVRTAQ